MRQNSSVTGTLSLKHGKTFFSVCFEENGWIAAEMVQFLDDLYSADTLEVGILKLLGYTLQISEQFPRRSANHWVELNLDNRILETNSDLIRVAVRRESPEGDEAYWGPALKRIHAVLHAHNFTVRLYS